MMIAHGNIDDKRSPLPRSFVLSLIKANKILPVIPKARHGYGATTLRWRRWDFLSNTPRRQPPKEYKFPKQDHECRSVDGKIEKRSLRVRIERRHYILKRYVQFLVSLAIVQTRNLPAFEVAEVAPDRRPFLFADA